MGCRGRNPTTTSTGPCTQEQGTARRCSTAAPRRNSSSGEEFGEEGGGYAKQVQVNERGIVTLRSCSGRLQDTRTHPQANYGLPARSLRPTTGYACIPKLTLSSHMAAWRRIADVRSRDPSHGEEHKHLLGLGSEAATAWRRASRSRSRVAVEAEA